MGYTHTKQGYTVDKTANDCEVPYNGSHTMAGRELLPGSARSNITFTTAQLHSSQIMWKRVGRPSHAKPGSAP